MKQSNKHIKKENKSLLFVFFLFLFLFSIPYIVKWLAEDSCLNLSSKNELGDAIGGLTSPIIGIGGIILTFLAFYIQYDFNKKQFSRIEDERTERLIDKENEDERIYRQNFDQKFYKLLNLHCSNVNQFNIDNRFYDRKTFVQMHRELEIIYHIVKGTFGEGTNLNALEFSYSIFFHGIDENEINRHKKSKNLFEQELIDIVVNQLNVVQHYYHINLIKSKSKYLIFDLNSVEIELFFYPFDGHSHRLGHYFRHLINFLEIIDLAQYLTKDEKQQYVSILRSQLSNYEQALIYYNSIAWYKTEWYKFIVDYKLIKNLPLELTKIDISPDIYFASEIENQKKNGESLFFWVQK